ncbi:MAG: formimidoylglutamate deiminase [Pseudomonadota bacterium]
MSIHAFEFALLPDGLARNVAIEIDDGRITRVTPNSAQTGAAGLALPGMANLHSHAHQRAMAGLAEHASGQSGVTDSFWTWRKIMYGFLDHFEPEHLYAVARQLYIEMLKVGYTRVAEFQYLHHQPDGTPYDERATMTLHTIDAARDAGIGITSLPVHYQFGGFNRQPVSEQQRRFFNLPDDYVQLVSQVDAQSTGNANCGIALHSLRAVDTQTFERIAGQLDVLDERPIHIHIAEQQKEVDDCLAWSGARPVEFLFDRFPVTSNWCLIHATHLDDRETTRLAKSGAVAGLCPTTEANLGDGLFNAVDYLHQEGAFGIGSDSHISVSPVEELRWLEYGQRLRHQGRNLLCAEASRHTGLRLYQAAASDGARACGHRAGVLAPGMQADMVVLDTQHPLLVERDPEAMLDSYVFSGNTNTITDVYVDGQKVIDQGHHRDEQDAAHRFRTTLTSLRSSL